jgi:hypothetical protein
MGRIVIIRVHIPAVYLIEGVTIVMGMLDGEIVMDYLGTINSNFVGALLRWTHGRWRWWRRGCRHEQDSVRWSSRRILAKRRKEVIERLL